MKKLKVDLELLVQSFAFDYDDLGKEYFDTHTGHVINIPYEVNKAAEKNEEDNLEDWQMQLLEEAYAIKEDKEHRYILIPNIEDSYYHNSMADFIIERVNSMELKSKLLKALKENNAINSFKSTLSRYEDELDNWHDYEEEKLKKYVEGWLNKIGIELENC